MKSYLRVHFGFMLFAAFFLFNNNISAQWESLPITTDDVGFYGFHVFNDSVLILFDTYGSDNLGDNGFTQKRATDYGNSWNTDSSPLISWFDDFYFLNQFVNNTTGWLYFNGPFFRTTNGGITWLGSRITESFNGTSMYFINELDGWICTDENISKTTNGGVSWDTIATLSSGHFYKSIYFLDGNNGFGIDDTMLMRTTDGGYNWNNQNINNTLNKQLFKVIFTDLTHGFIISQDGIVFKTTDGGNSWDQKYSEIPYDLHAISFINQNIGLVSGWTFMGNYICKVSYTTDGGDTWDLDTTYFGIGSSRIIKDMSFTSPSYGYAISTDSIYRYHNDEGLPVELFSFNGNYKQSGNNVELNWSTATELSNNGFDIERKTSNNWIKIGFVKGSGNSTSNKSYSFKDNNISNLQSAAYRLKQIDFDGTYKYSKEIKVNINNLPTVFKLEQNYPNPFNPSTTIKYQIPFVKTHRVASVQLKIYDVLGNEVATLVNEEKPAGNYEVKFDANNLSSGVYFYKLSTQDFISVKKMLLLK